MNTNNPSPQNAVLLQGCTLADIERMINKAVGERMKAFYESIIERPPVLIKRKVAAERLGISLPTLDAYAKAGFLQARHLGGRVYFDEADVEKYAQNQKPRTY
jgi:excisionase family DNA binding protein